MRLRLRYDTQRRGFSRNFRSRDVLTRPGLRERHSFHRLYILRRDIVGRNFGDKMRRITRTTPRMSGYWTLMTCTHILIIQSDGGRAVLTELVYGVLLDNFKLLASFSPSVQCRSSAMPVSMRMRTGSLAADRRSVISHTRTSHSAAKLFSTRGIHTRGLQCRTRTTHSAAKLCSTRGVHTRGPRCRDQAIGSTMICAAVRFSQSDIREAGQGEPAQHCGRVRSRSTIRECWCPSDITGSLPLGFSMRSGLHVDRRPAVRDSRHPTSKLIRWIPPRNLVCCLDHPARLPLDGVLQRHGGEPCVFP
ncbi:hypothetical protein OBBRIDRAFT_390955 [Obba rivulosa]|uniref:Uncharacterized protein n=1 Tax=Obba rivulosa TaxID=1052685 RepID=A0A8E2APX3_9APHY|nr:hypothetical protein OBBRIDRAFT_390955 [Obba rivulosa]